MCQEKAMQSSSAVLLVGHADPRSFNHRLAAAYEQGFRAAGERVTRFDLADLKFDPVLRTGYREPQPLEPDLLRVRSAIEQCAHLVWVFPTYWASPPSSVRALFERLFLPGWAFRYEKGKAFPLGLLKGRSSRVITTMDSPGWWYTLHYRRAVHSSFGVGSLAFCGLRPVEFTTIYSVSSQSEARRERIVEKVQKLAATEARARAQLHA